MPDPIDATDDARRRTHRTGVERFAIGASFATAVLAVLTAGALAVGYVLVTSRSVTSLANPADITTTTATTTSATTTPPATTPDTADTADTTDATDTTTGTRPSSTTPATRPPTTLAPTTTGAPTTPAPTFPDADPEASNFLLTGADNGACIDPDSPYAGAFGDREGMGERSDTIMMIRVDPSTSRMAVLSFPRDLWVEIAGTGNRQRINSAYRRDDPQRLVDTIYENFGIGVDHFIQVDFCAFKTLVDAVGGVAVPFEFPARDDNTGLNVPVAGCFTFDGEHALAYVRSRHYEYENPDGEWEQDGTSDLGRISRQQDFLRRVLSAVLAEGPLNPAVARGLLEASQDYVVTDDGLSPQKLLEFAGVLSDVEPGLIPSYQIESSPRTINGASVLEPRTGGDNMQAVLALFSGETSLGEAPDQVFATTTVASGRPGGTESTEPVITEFDTTDPSTGTSVPNADDAPEENTAGIVPPRNIDCS